MQDSRTLADELNDRGADRTTVQQAARQYVMERSDFTPVEDMKSRLIDELGADDYERLRRKFEKEAKTLEDACLYVLSDAWTSDQDAVDGILDEAKDALPVIEVGILAIVAMYGMYLVATRGIESEERTTRATPDGGFEETTKRVYHDPAAPLGKVLGMFKPGTG